MTAVELKSRLLAGRTVLGTLIVSTSPKLPENAAKVGFDFVFIDTEHIAIDRDKLSWMCLAYRGLGLPPIVRVPAPDPYLACMALDGGAAGIIAPYVETPEQARALVGAVKYRPLKGRKLEDFLRGKAKLEPALLSYLEAANAGHFLILNIESQPAIDALDQILAVPGIDGVLIGPHDLSCSLGRPEDYESPEFRRAARTIFAQARARGVGAGIHSWMGVDRTAEFVREGANLVIHEADVIVFRDHAIEEIQRLRTLLGEAPAAAGPVKNDI